MADQENQSEGRRSEINNANHGSSHDHSRDGEISFDEESQNDEGNHLLGRETAVPLYDMFVKLNDNLTGLLEAMKTQIQSPSTVNPPRTVRETPNAVQNRSDNANRLIEPNTSSTSAIVPISSLNDLLCNVPVLPVVNRTTPSDIGTPSQVLNSQNNNTLNPWSLMAKTSVQNLMPRTFDGSAQSDPVTFLNSIKSLIESHPVALNQFCTVIRGLLQGRALVWFNTISGTLSSPEQFIERFRSEFLSARYVRHLKFKISKQRMEPNEAIVSYIDRLAYMHSSLPDPSSEDIVIDNILNTITRRAALHMCTRTYDTVSDLREQAYALDNLLPQNNFQRYDRPPDRGGYQNTLNRYPGQDPPWNGNRAPVPNYNNRWQPGPRYNQRGDYGYDSDRTGNYHNRDSHAPQRQHRVTFANDMQLNANVTSQRLNSSAPSFDRNTTRNQGPSFPLNANAVCPPATTTDREI